MRRISKGKESILHYTRFSSVWMDEVAALYSVLSLSLSLTRGIRDSNIFSDNDPEFFSCANYIEIRVLKNVLRSSRVIVRIELRTFFHPSRKTS